MEKIYRVQMNSSGMPNFSTAVEIDTDLSEYSDKLWKNAYERGKADRPKGQWVDGDGNPVPIDKYGDVMGSAFCTNCGDWLSASDEYAVRGYFCPNCGARMKGADDE